MGHSLTEGVVYSLLHRKPKSKLPTLYHTVSIYSPGVYTFTTTFHHLFELQLFAFSRNPAFKFVVPPATKQDRAFIQDIYFETIRYVVEVLWLLQQSFLDPLQCLNVEW